MKGWLGGFSQSISQNVNWWPFTYYSLPITLMYGGDPVPTTLMYGDPVPIASLIFSNDPLPTFLYIYFQWIQQ